MPVVPPWVPVERFGVVVALVVTATALFVLDPPRGRWGSALRRRFLIGLPWGTFTVVAFVLAVYLVIQGGFRHWGAPVTIPFRAWSYFYPLGMITAAFSHAGPGHLVGNLVGTLTLATLVEYAYGHFPRERGTSTFSSWWTNPFVRAFVVFPLAIVVVGVLTALFSLGPVIGFSGVVFAFAGFALVYFPLATVLALASGTVLRVTYAALLTPSLTAKAEPAFVTPWWAQIAIQGHALGFVLGVLVGVAFARWRADDLPSPIRLLLGILLVGFVQSLWAVYWFRGNDEFVLFRALGVALVFLLATLVVVAVSATDNPLLRSAPDGSFRAIPRWQAAVALLVVGAAAVSGAAVPANLSTASDDPLGGERVEVRDYEVTYVENVSNGMVSVLDVEAFGESTTVNTSGVVVRSEARGIWLNAASKGRLDFAGRASVRVGGVGWREVVVAEREGWDVAGGDTAYRVTLEHDGRTRPVFASPPAEAKPVLAGRTIAVVADPSGFSIRVGRNDSQSTAPVPATNESVTLDGVTVVHVESELVAVVGETRVPIASRETYQGQQND